MSVKFGINAKKTYKDLYLKANPLKWIYLMK